MDRDHLTSPPASAPIEIAVGERATIELRSNPTTGYRWDPVGGEVAVVRIVSDDYVPPAEQIPGAGGSQHIVVEGLAVGTDTVVFGYHRPWETETPPVETASFRFTVT